jgi:hypothetical protein
MGCDKNTVIALSNIGNVLKELSQARLDKGIILDHLVRLIIKYYSSLDMLMKYFYIRVKNYKDAVRHAKLEDLEKKILKDLGGPIYNIITYLSVSSILSRIFLEVFSWTSFIFFSRRRRKRLMVRLRLPPVGRATPLPGAELSKNPRSSPT